MLSSNLMDEFENRLVVPGHTRQHQVRQYRHVGNDVRVIELLVVIIAHIHLVELKQIACAKVPGRLCCQAERANPVKDTWRKKYDVTFFLVEGDYRDLVGQAPVDVAEPETFMLLEVDLVCFKGQLAEGIDMLRLRYAMPE